VGDYKRMSKLINRFAFIPMSAWETVKDIFPHSVSYGDSKVIGYDSPKASEEMMKLVNVSGLELIHHSKSDAKMIIDAIESGIDKVYNCNTDVAREVVAHFCKGDL